MKRILFAILIWILLIGGLSAYMRHRDSRPVERSSGKAAVAASGKYSLELTPAFEAVADPFALRSNGESAPVLSARFRGRDVLGLEKGPGAGVPVRIEELPGVVRGMNEVVVAASPPADTPSRRQFLQARVLRDGVPVAAETFWADGSARVEGVLVFSAGSVAGEASNGE